MAKITPDAINNALEASERIQYRALLGALSEGKLLNRDQQAKYDAYESKIQKYLAAQDPDAHASDAPPPSSSPEDIGIPLDLRVRRRYTLTSEAIEQRRKAAQSPAKSAASVGNRNNWKHGLYVKNFINKMRPCKSTCPHYPCELVDDGETSPGEDCLDKVEVMQFYRAVHKAIDKKDYDDFNDLVALQIGNVIKVVDMLIEDLMRDGTVVKRERHDAKDNLITEYVTHPSLLALPKLIADLGLSPAEFLITPRSKTRAKTDEEGVKTLADLMSRAGKVFKKRDQEEEDG